MKAPGTSQLAEALPILRAIPASGWVIVGVIAALLLAALVWWWFKRFRAAGKPAVAEKPKPAKRGPDLSAQIIAAWRGFARGLSLDRRRSLDQFHPVIVLGTEGSGKAEVIEAYSGIRQRRGEFGSSAHSASAQLRVAIGLDALVLELSEEICRAPAQSVESGLGAVLGPLCKKRVPLVVVCVSAESLEKKDEAELYELGSALRGKIDLLSELRGEPVPVRVVVPEVAAANKLHGLFRLLRLPGTQAIFQLGDVSEGALNSLLLRYVDRLPAALIALPPADNLALIGFLEAIPRISTNLSALLSELVTRSTHRTPIVEDTLYFVPLTGGPNPIEVPSRMQVAAPSPLLKHRVIATSVLSSAAALMVAQCHSERDRWELAVEAARKFTPAADSSLESIELETAAAYSEAVSPLFFASGPGVVGCTFAERLRHGFLVKELDRNLTSAAPSPEDAVYVLALMYAAKGNRLADIIKRAPSEWLFIEDKSTAPLNTEVIKYYLSVATPLREALPVERAVRKLSESSTWPQELTQLQDFLVLASNLSVEGAPPSASREFEQTRVLEAARAFEQISIPDWSYDDLEEVLATPPLRDTFQTAKAFRDANQRRFATLTAIGRARSELGSLQGAVRDLLAPAAAGTTENFADLVRKLAPLVKPTTTRQRFTFVFDFAGGSPKEYKIEYAALFRALRGAAINDLVRRFLRADQSSFQLFFGNELPTGQLSLPVVTPWPQGVSAARVIERRATSTTFQEDVLAPSRELARIWPELEPYPDTRARLSAFLQPTIERYAAEYLQELDRVYQSLAVEVGTDAAVERVFTELSAESSPLRQFLRAFANEATLKLGSDDMVLLRPMQAIDAKYGPVNSLLVAGKSGEPLTGYLDILADVARKFDVAAGSASGGPASKADTSGVSSDLSSGGRLTLSLLRDVSGSSLAATQRWASENKLSPELTEFFLKPLRALYQRGKGNLEGALGSWYQRLNRDLDAELLGRFPFDTGASEDVSPDALAAWLHPKTGRLFQELAANVEPTFARAVIQDGGRRVSYVANPCVPDLPCVSIPAAALRNFGRLSTLSRSLWDESGKPQLLRMRVVPQPFPATNGSKPVPTLVRLTVGESGLFYFNQRPQATELTIDWTKPSTSTLAVDLEKSEALVLEPPVITSDGSPWSFFRLLAQSRSTRQGRTWSVPVGASDHLDLTFQVSGDVGAFGGFPRSHGTVSIQSTESGGIAVDTVRTASLYGFE